MIKTDVHGFLDLTQFCLTLVLPRCDNILLLKGTLLKCVGLCEEKDKETVKNIVLYS